MICVKRVMVVMVVKFDSVQHWGQRRSYLGNRGRVEVEVLVVRIRLSSPALDWW
jgi:hypothetical protein